jgi:DNA-binding transcriptional LysR family regulator
MDKFEAMRVFCNVIEAGGFASAADRMGLSTSAVSRHVAQLEANLNVRLLNRTTRRMSPTEEGFAYFERCTQLLADLEEAETSVSGKAQHPRGRLRLTAPIALATLRLAPAFAAFVRAYPDVTLDLVLSDGIADFAEEGLDLAIRVGRVGSDNLVARRIGETTILLAASPDYLARAGTPVHPDDLSRHACMTYAYSSTGNLWQFTDPTGAPLNVRIGGPVHANNGMFLSEMAAAGCGIVQAPCFILEPLIKRGQLVRVLAEQGDKRLPIHAVYPTRRHLSAKVQAMTAFLDSWFKASSDAPY